MTSFQPAPTGQANSDVTYPGQQTHVCVWVRLTTSRRKGIGRWHHLAGASADADGVFSMATFSASRGSNAAQSCLSSTSSLRSNAPANASTSACPVPAINSSYVATGLHPQSRRAGSRPPFKSSVGLVAIVPRRLA
jgi:hypothetical protein